MHIRGPNNLCLSVCACNSFCRTPNQPAGLLPTSPGVQCIRRVYTMSWVVEFLLTCQPFGGEYYLSGAKLPLSRGLHYWVGASLLFVSPAADSRPPRLTDWLTASWKGTRPASRLESLRVEAKWLSADPPPPPVQVSATVTYRKPSRTLLCVACPACPSCILTQQKGHIRQDHRRVTRLLSLSISAAGVCVFVCVSRPRGAAINRQLFTAGGGCTVAREAAVV